MPTNNTPFSPGDICWADLTTSDPAASRAFYGALFGWEFEISGPEMGNYTMCTLGGKYVAGMGSAMKPNHPTVWTPYLATADIAATAEQITSAGGQIQVGPMTIPGQPGQDAGPGTMLVATDSTSGTFALWQPGWHTGFGLTGEPGTMAWAEFLTRDYPASLAFYEAIAGWSHTETTTDHGPYAMCKLAGNTVAGLSPMPPGIPEQAPPFWNLYFQVADADASVNTAAGLGATVVYGPVDTPFGRFAVLTDPQGGGFNVFVPPAVWPPA